MSATLKSPTSEAAAPRGQATWWSPGVWNVVAEADKGTDYQGTLMLKYTLVAVSGVTAYLHGTAGSRGAMAVFGAPTGPSAITTLFVGILLAASG